MASNPRRFGVVDAGAALAVILAAGGVIWSPKLSGAVAKATGAMRSVTVLVDVRGIPAADPAALMEEARRNGQVSIVIRNQPHGSVTVKEVKPLPRRISAFLPSGTLISAPDPNQQVFSTLDARFVLQGEGRKGSDGVVFGNQNLKIGAPIELEGPNFRVVGTVTGLQLGAS